MVDFAKKVLLLVAVFALICILQNNSACAASKSSKKVQLKRVVASTTNKSYKIASRGSIAPTIIADIGSVVCYAKQFLGVKYIYGASGPKAFDCSGFTMYILGNFGISLPHSARSQSGYGINANKDNLKPGDLIFFATNGSKSISHVGLYIGNGSFIHAASNGGVMINRLSEGYYSRNYLTARRIIKSEST